MKKIVFALMVVVLVSCGKDEAPDIITLDRSEVALYFGDNYQIEARSNSTIAYESKDEYHASVTTDGLVIARYVGETSISLSNAEDDKLLKITVQPKYSLYPEPEVEFGASKADVISKFGEPVTDTGTAIGYDEYSPGAPILMFAFDENDKVAAYSVMVSAYRMEGLVNFIGERYHPAGSTDGMFIFMNGLKPETASMAVAISLYNSNYVAALYLPYSNLKSITGSQSLLFDVGLENL